MGFDDWLEEGAAPPARHARPTVGSLRAERIVLAFLDSGCDCAYVREGAAESLGLDAGALYDLLRRVSYKKAFIRRLDVRKDRGRVLLVRKGGR